MKLAGHKELKAVILSLPVKEKDKLLLRLIAKDKILTEHLHFKLLEDESDLEYRKEQIKADTDKVVDVLKKLPVKEALTRIRKMITGVNHFYKVTRDTFGEVELKIYILNAVPVSYKKEYFGYRDFAALFGIFYVKTLLATLKKFEKLHEDLQFDLTEKFNDLLAKVYSSRLAYYAKEVNLPERID